jgi:hypothetical protein
LFWFDISQNFPGPSFFLTPFLSVIQPASGSIRSAPFGSSAAALWAVVLCVQHARFRRRVFGAAHNIEESHPLAKRINAIASEMGVRVGQIVRTDDVGRIDAVAYGFASRHTLLVGYKLSAMAGTAPHFFKEIIAHELSHFKNKDVVATFVCRSLVISSLVTSFAALVLIGICVPMRQVVMNYSNFSSLSQFWRFQKQFVLWYLENGIVFFFVIHGVFVFFWLISIWLQFLLFLRSRELMADVRAGEFVDLSKISECRMVAQKAGHHRFLRLPQLFYAHPSPEARLAALRRPKSLARHQGSRYFILGLLAVETLRSSTKVEPAILAFYPRLQQALGQSWDVERFRAIFNFDDIWASFIYLTLATLPHVITLVAMTTLLRSVIALSIEWTGFCNALAQVLVAFALFTAGCQLGASFDPGGHFDGPGQLHKILDVRFFYPLQSFNVGTVFAINFVAASAFLLLATLFITGQGRVGPWPKKLGFCFVLASYLVAGQFTGPFVVQAVLGSPVWTMVGKPEFWIGTSIYLAVWIGTIAAIRKAADIGWAAFKKRMSGLRGARKELKNG